MIQNILEILIGGLFIKIGENMNPQKTYELINKSKVCKEQKDFAKSIIEALTGEKDNSVKQTEFKQGHFYQEIYYNKNVYICACVDFGKGNISNYSLISLKDGNRWCSLRTLDELNKHSSKEFHEVKIDITRREVI